MSKGERISQLVSQLTGAEGKGKPLLVSEHPYYRAFFQCWNEQRYYEAHDVLEQVWLNTETSDDDFFKGLIQGAGAYLNNQPVSDANLTVMEAAVENGAILLRQGKKKYHRIVIV